MEHQVYLGIDYGGTFVKLGLVNDAGEVIDAQKVQTEPLCDVVQCRTFAARVSAFVDRGLAKLRDESAISLTNFLAGAGLAVPGPVCGGHVETPNARADWSCVAHCLGEALGCEHIELVNDANAAALGESWLGAAVGASSLLFVTLGTGVGSGVVVDGCVISGAHGAAGELGHVNVELNGRLCNCGKRGCMERYSSATGIVQTYRELVAVQGQEAKDAQRGAALRHPLPRTDTDALTVFEAFAAGDETARRAVAVMAEKLGMALAAAACIVDPEVIVIGGGVSESADCFLDDVEQSFSAHCFTACATTKIRVAALKGDAGFIGAARYAMK